MNIRYTFMGWTHILTTVLVLRTVYVTSEPDATWTLTTPAGANNEVQSLGSFPHVCFGNVEKCTYGTTKAFQFRAANETDKYTETYFLSSGGQSPASEGFYFRQNYGKEYEIGVTKRSQLWRVKFGLVPQVWVTLAFTWSQTNGLKVYADGLLAGEARMSESRFYMSFNIDPYPFIMVGKANDDATYMEKYDGEISWLKHWDSMLSSDEILGLVGGQDWRLGCVPYSKWSTGGVETTVDGDDDVAIFNCRQHCQKTRKQVAMLKNNGLCGCIEYIEDIWHSKDLQQNCGKTSWKTYIATHVRFNLISQISLEIEEKRLTSKPYTLPGETVLFDIITDADEDVWFEVNFGDGTVVETSDLSVSHDWAQEGNYSVNITARGRTVKAQAATNVIITFVDEGIGPEVVHLDFHEEPSESRLIKHRLTAIGRAPIHCTFDFGDNSPKREFTFGTMIDSLDLYHNYSRPGFYEASAVCKNKFGSNSISSVARARNWHFDQTLMKTNLEVALPFQPMDAYNDKLEVYVNDVSVDYIRQNDQLLVPGKTFWDSKDTIVQVKYDDVTFINHILDIQEEIGDVSITLDTYHTVLNEDIYFTFEFGRGDPIFVHIDYGDGQTEDLYIEDIDRPVQVKRIHSYDTLGLYYVKLEAANKIHYVSSYKVVTIERPLSNAEFFVHNVSHPYDPINFTVVADKDLPPIPLTCIFFYRDGTNESVHGMTFDENGVPFNHLRRFADFGIYVVDVVVSNNISSITLSKLLQVGVNLTYVDLTTKTERVLVKYETAVIQITCPTGSGVTYTMDFGDGEMLVILPHDLPTTPDPFATTTPHPMLSGNHTDFPGSGNFTTDGRDATTSDEVFTTVASFRKRRSVNGSLDADLGSGSGDILDVSGNDTSVTNGDAGTSLPEATTVFFGSDGNNISNVFVSTTPASMEEIGIVTMDPMATQPTFYYNDFRVPVAPIAGPDDFVRSENGHVLHVKHRFRKTGSHLVTVKASNKFGHVSNELCQKIVVRHKRQDADSCKNPVIKFKRKEQQDTTLTYPYLRMRSEEIPLPINPGLDCGDVSEATYSWKVFRIHSKSPYHERPTHEVCSLLGKEWKYIIPPNTLPWGLYRLQVSVSPKSNDLTYNTKSLIVDVMPTPLVAHIEGDIIQTAKKYDIITVNMNATHDPDESNDWDPALRLDVFCYPQSALDNVQALTLEELKASSRLIKNSSQVYVYSVHADGPCFLNKKHGKKNSLVDFYGKTIRFSASNMGSNDTYNMQLFVSKTHREILRVSNYSVRYQVWSSNTSFDGMLTMMDELLAKGDTGAVVMVLDTASEQLSEDNSTEAQEVVGKLIDVVDKVADDLKSADQVLTTCSCLGQLSGSSGGQKEDKKKAASNAVRKMAAKTGDVSAKESLETVGEIGGSVVGVMSNVVPENIDEDKKMGEFKKRRRRRRRRSVEDDQALENYYCRQICTECLPPPVGPFDEEPQIPEPKNKLCPALYMDTRKLCELFDDEEVCIMNTYWHPIDRELEYQIRKKDFDAELQEKKDNDKAVTNNLQDAAGSVSNVMLDKAPEEDEEGNEPAPLTLESDKITLKLAKINRTTTTGDQKMAAKGGGVNMPTDLLDEAGGNDTETRTKFMTTDGNPFSWGKGANNVKSKVVQFALSGPDGKEKKVQNTSKPFDIRLGKDPAHLGAPVNFTILKRQIKLHHTLISINDTTLHIHFRPHRPNDVYKLYLKYQGFPNETYYDWEINLPRELNPNDVPEDTDPEVVEELKYTFAPPANLTSLNGSYYVGVQLLYTVLNLQEPEDDVNHTYTWHMYTANCMFWNEEIDDWSGDGCRVGELTTKNSTQCLCNHLTNFGGDFVVPPNTIDFSTVFAKFKDLDENAAVFSTVVSILGLYFILLIWARRADKKDVQKWGASPLEDNLPTDNYHYQIAVHTGMRKQAGTSSKVSFILSGDEGDSGVRKLDDGKRKHFERGSILNYILSNESSLGPLTFLRIWHDNSGHGKSRSWFLEQVEITDLQTGDRFFFLCDRWLAVEEDDGMVERILPVAGLEDLSNFKHLFSSSVKKKLTNEHLWFSVISRPTRSHFTRVQRISCCLSLLFCTMIANAMFFRKESDTKTTTAITLGPFSFTMSQLYISLISTLIVFPVNLILVTIFRKARQKKNNIQQMNQAIKSKKFRWRGHNGGSSLWNNVEKTRMQKFKDSMGKILTFHQRSKYETEIPDEELPISKKKKKGWSLPHWFIYIAWILCFFSVMGSAFFVILYSMEWGREKANDWLVTFLLSFFQSVVVVQPIKVFLLAAFISCILKKPELEEEEPFDADELLPKPDEELIAKKKMNLQALIAQRKIAASSIKPPDTAALQEAREIRLKEIAMEGIIKEIIVYFFFLLILFFLSYQTRSRHSFLLHDNIKQTFVENSPNFKSINTVPLLWKWIDQTLLPGLYSGPYYNGKLLNWREALNIQDFGAVRVGVGRLRQLRIKDDTCTVQPLFQNLIHHCRDDYNWDDDDAKNYLPAWQKFETENETALEILDEKDTPWVYKSSLRLKNAPYMGTVNFYKGGGYSVNLGRTYKHAQHIVQELKDNDWMDVNTRGLFIEFNLYNANVNLFVSVIMLVEFLAAGGTAHRTEIKVFRLFPYVGGFGIFVLLFEILYGCFTVYFLFREINKIRKERMRYFKNFWNGLEFATLAFCVTAVVMYIMKIGIAHLALEALHESQAGDFINFQTIALWDELLGYMIAIVVFTATVKSLKLLKFNRRMGMLGDTIRVATKDLKAFSLTFFLYFSAFCQMAYLLFGRQLPSYGTFIGAVEALFAFALGDFNFDDMRSVNPVLGPLFFFAFVGIVYIGLMGMFLTIIYDAFAQVKRDTEMQSNDYEMVDFIWRRFRGMFGMSTNQQPPEPEPEEDKNDERR